MHCALEIYLASPLNAETIRRKILAARPGSNR